MGYITQAQKHLRTQSLQFGAAPPNRPVVCLNRSCPFDTLADESVYSVEVVSNDTVDFAMSELAVPRRVRYFQIRRRRAPPCLAVSDRSGKSVTAAGDY